MNGRTFATTAVRQGSGPHRGDGNATNWVSTVNNNYVWDNSFVAQSPATACLQNRSDQFIVAYYDSAGLSGGPAGATNSWSAAESKVSNCLPSGMTNFWPNRDANGQALIHLQAGQMYYMQLEHWQNGGGYAEGVTYKIAGQPDPFSGDADVTPSVSGAPSSDRRSCCGHGAVYASHIHRRKRQWACDHLHGCLALRDEPVHHHQCGDAVVGQHRHLLGWPIAIQRASRQPKHVLSNQSIMAGAVLKASGENPSDAFAAKLLQLLPNVIVNGILFKLTY